MVAQLVKNPPAMQETSVRVLGWKDPLEEGMATHSSILAWSISMDRGAWQAIVHRVAKSQTQLKELSMHTYRYWSFPGSSAGKESTCNAGDPGLIPRLGRSPGEGIGYPRQYSWDSLVAQMVKNPLSMQET